MRLDSRKLSKNHNFSHPETLTLSPSASALFSPHPGGKLVAPKARPIRYFYKGIFQDFIPVESVTMCFCTVSVTELRLR